MKNGLALGLLVVVGCAGRTDPRSAPERIDGLIAFWDFQEPAGSPRVSKGPRPYALREMHGPIRRAEGGVFGPYCADLEHPQWFRIPRAEIGELDLHGAADVTVVAWIRRESDRLWQYVAGVWNERDAKRQYALFTCGHKATDHRDFSRSDVRFRAHGYVSAGGGATPGHPFCFSYATGGTVLEKDRWIMIAYTYDRRSLRVYLDGVLDRQEHMNPFPYGEPIFDGGPQGADFTVAQRALPHWMGYPDERYPRAEGFDGRIGGLAVYRRALSAEEIAALHAEAKGNRP